MDYVREGDTVVVWKLDRLGRNMLEHADGLIGDRHDHARPRASRIA